MTTYWTFAKTLWNRDGAIVMERSESEVAIVKALANANIGHIHADDHFSAADRVLSELRRDLPLKTYTIHIRQDSADAPRMLTVEWSRLLSFPSQSFSVRISDLTRENLEVEAVMDS
jgi:hypothetical protein